MSRRASVPAIWVLSASRLIPRISRARRESASARVTCSQRLSSAYVMPGGLDMPGIGHQVQSVVSPPIRNTGG